MTPLHFSRGGPQSWSTPSSGFHGCYIQKASGAPKSAPGWTCPIPVHVSHHSQLYCAPHRVCRNTEFCLGVWLIAFFFSSVSPHSEHILKNKDCIFSSLRTFCAQVFCDSVKVGGLQGLGSGFKKFHSQAEWWLTLPLSPKPTLFIVNSTH